nr:hypothetical protein StreXyl84_00960 [Streptomyces sp. Xyl84]
MPRNPGDVKQMLTVGSQRRAGAVDITAQWIKTSWTKQSRGGDAAARRNAAPVGSSLPQVPSFPVLLDQDVSKECRRDREDRHPAARRRQAARQQGDRGRS